VDFDVHHGNGTQARIRGRPLGAIHQPAPAPAYVLPPAAAHDYEIGDHAGRGFTLNIPFMPGAGDTEYLQAFDNKVIPKLNDFKFDMLLISAGFDAHREDPLAQIELSEDCFEQMTRKARRSCGRAL